MAEENFPRHDGMVSADEGQAYLTHLHRKKLASQKNAGCGYRIVKCALFCPYASLRSYDQYADAAKCLPGFSLPEVYSGRI